MIFVSFQSFNFIFLVFLSRIYWELLEIIYGNYNKEMLATWQMALIVFFCIIVIGLALGLGLGLGLKSNTTTQPTTTVTSTTTITPTVTLSPVPAVINSNYTYVPYITTPSSDGFIMILNKDTGIAERSIALTPGIIPQQIVIAPDLKTAYVCDPGLDTIGILDITQPDTVTTLSGSINLTSSILTGQHPICGIITPDGKWLYVGTSGNPARIIQIKLADNTVTKLIDNGPDFYNIFSIVVDPLGTMLYAANETSSRGFVPIDIADPDNPVVKPFVVVPTVGSQNINNLVISSDGLYLYIIPNNIVDPNVYQYDINTQTLNQSTSTITSGPNITSIAISPDNKTLYAVSSATNPASCNLYTIDIANNYSSTFIPMYTPTGTENASAVQADQNLILTTGFDLAVGNGRINRFDATSTPLVPPITTPSGAFFLSASPFRVFGQTFV